MLGLLLTCRTMWVLISAESSLLRIIFNMKITVIQKPSTTFTPKIPSIYSPLNSSPRSPGFFFFFLNVSTKLLLFASACADCQYKTTTSFWDNISTVIGRWCRFWWSTLHDCQDSRSTRRVVARNFHNLSDIKLRRLHPHLSSLALSMKQNLESSSSFKLGNLFLSESLGNSKSLTTAE